MLIIVEGPDGSGKTTFANKLEEQLQRRDFSFTHQVDLLHAGPMEEGKDPIDEYVMPLIKYRPGQLFHVICDRWHLGERIYPKLFGRKSKLDMARWRYIESFLQSRGAVVVRMTTDTTTLIDRVCSRGDDLVGAPHIGDLCLMYDNLSQDSILPVIELADPTDIDVHTIINYARQVENKMARLNRFRTYVGPANPSTLLLGDIRGPAKRGDPQFDWHTAFMPYSNTSGHYLYETLAGAPLQFWADRGIGVANACDVDDPDDLQEALDYPLTVVMGRDAAISGTKFSRYVPHPQYVRRFHHARQEEYREQLLYGSDVRWN